MTGALWICVLFCRHTARAAHARVRAMRGRRRGGGGGAAAV
eukprot:COSAG01_NODE_38665_length_486_cov_9.416021_1_plen_40_part_10